MPTPDDKYKKSRLSQHTGSPFKSSPLNRNKNIYGLKTEATMTPAQKRKDTMLKKKYEKSDDMMKSFKDQYGKEKGKNVFLQRDKCIKLADKHNFFISVF